MDADQTDADPSESQLARPGDRIGHYRIVSELGRGGMGIVYRARDLDLGREVALKRPWPRIAADPECRRRFLREGRSAAVIAHPNIVQVFEAFEYDDCPWLALQYVPGRNLESVLAQQMRLPVEAVLRYGEDIASALKAAHDRSILHRDIKPCNVLISSDDRALLSDFGLACAVRGTEVDPSATTESEQITSDGAVVGTPRYMSPEQALGRPLDKRSDIFSLGSVLYELCTGVPAFSSSQLHGLTDAIIHTEPEPISRLNYEVPNELERIIRKAMAKRPDERYIDVGELLVDLRALRRKREMEEYAPPSPARRERSGRLSPWLLLALPILVAGLVWYIRSGPGAQTIPRVDPVQVTSADTWEGHPVISPDGGRLAYASDEGGDVDVYVVDVHGGGAPLRITNDPATDDSPTWFPDGSAIAFTSDRTGRSSIWKTGQLGGGATLLLEEAWQPAISPDGSRVAFARPGPSRYSRIGVASLSDPADLTMLTDDQGGVWDHEHPSWSPDGRQICYATRHGLWSVPSSGGSPHRLTTEAELDCDPVWSPSGRRIYFTSHRQGTIALWRVEASGEKPERVTFGTSQECQPSISRDGARLAYATRIITRNLIIHDLRTGRETALRTLPDAYQAAISVDQSLLVFVSPGAGKELALWLQPLEGGIPSGPPRQLTDHPGDSSHPAFSPDGRWIAYQRILKEERDIWIIPTRGGQPARFTEDPAGDMGPDWSPDGSMIAFASERGGKGSRIWIGPVLEGKPSGPARCLGDEPVQAFAPVWSPDGTQIVLVGADREGNGAWIVPVDGGVPPRPVTPTATITRAHWDASRGDLLISGVWEGRRYTLHRFSPHGGSGAPLDPPVDLGPETAPPTFDVSVDGRLVVFPREEAKGDIWLLEARGGRY